VIARWGVPPVFVLTAIAAGVLAVILLAWRRPSVVAGERDPFLPALVAGGRYVRHEPVVRRILVRFAAFIVPACAIWALLPLIASQQLGLDANGYGLLFAALGAGAVVAALTLGRVKAHLSSNAIVSLAAVGFGIAFATLTLVPNLWVSLPLLVVGGYAWTATVSSVISELQLFLPSWVRARAIAVYLTVFLGCQALASPVWGLLAQNAGLRTAVLVAAALVIAGAGGGLVWQVPDNQNIDRTPPPTGDQPPSPSNPSLAPGRWSWWSSTTSPTSKRPRSSPPWRTCGSPGFAAAPPAGTCIGWARARKSSSKSSRSRPGRNTSANTKDASPSRTKPSRTRPSATSWEPPATATTSPPAPSGPPLRHGPERRPTGEVEPHDTGLTGCGSRWL